MRRLCAVCVCVQGDEKRQPERIWRHTKQRVVSESYVIYGRNSTDTAKRHWIFGIFAYTIYPAIRRDLRAPVWVCARMRIFCVCINFTTMFDLNMHTHTIVFRSDKRRAASDIEIEIVLYAVCYCAVALVRTYGFCLSVRQIFSLWFLGNVQCCAEFSRCQLLCSMVYVHCCREALGSQTLTHTAINLNNKQPKWCRAKFDFNAKSFTYSEYFTHKIVRINAR